MFSAMWLIYATKKGPQGDEIFTGIVFLVVALIEMLIYGSLIDSIF